MPQVIDLTEVKAMLAERVQEWTKRWKQEGLEEGLQRGRAEGQAKGWAELLIRQLERKFGPLAPLDRQRILNAGQDDLWYWADRVLVANTLDEVFN